jgi:hypothetical protein
MIAVSDPVAKGRSTPRPNSEALDAVPSEADSRLDRPPRMVWPLGSAGRFS